MDCFRYLLVVEDIGYEFSTSVRLVTGRETTAEHQDVALVNLILHHLDGFEDILLCQIAEYPEFNHSSCAPPGFSRVVVAVRTRENRDEHLRVLNWLTLVSHLRLLDLKRLDAFHPGWNQFLVICWGSVRINLGKSLGVLSHKVENVKLVPVDSQDAVLPIGDFSKENGIFVIKRLL